MTTGRVASIVILAIVILGAAAGAWAYLQAQRPSLPSGYGAALELCRSFANGGTERIAPTSRVFINLPKTLYPNDVTGFFKTATGTATVGVVSNGGKPGEALQSSEYCSSTYVEFNGTGEIDLTVPPAAPTIPQYSVRFIIGS